MNRFFDDGMSYPISVTFLFKLQCINDSRKVVNLTISSFNKHFNNDVTWRKNLTVWHIGWKDLNPIEILPIYNAFHLFMVSNVVWYQLV